MVVFLTVPRCIRCSLASLLSGQRPVIREKGEKGRQLAAGNRYRAPLQTGIVANFFEILTFFSLASDQGNISPCPGQVWALSIQFPPRKAKRKSSM